MKYSRFTFLIGTFFLALLVALFPSVPVSAQFTASLETAINVDMYPENPGPNQKVSVSLSGYTTDLNAADITWKLNGKTLRRGTGIKNFSFTTGDLNTETKLDITIVTIEGETLVKSYSIQPSSVDLIWQSEGYVPPFYKGKPLFSYENKIQFVAVPHLIGSNGKEILAENLIYTWEKDGTVLGDHSGYGKNTYTMVGSIVARPVTVNVVVTSSDSPAIGEAAVTVSPRDPSVVLYEKDPLYGIRFNIAAANMSIGQSKEIELVAVPFYFGVTEPDSSALSYNWSLNGRTIDTYGGTSKTFRQEEGVYGSSAVSVRVEHLSKVLQSALQSVNMVFAKPAAQ